MIHYGHQCIAEEDIDAVMAVLRSDMLTQGEKVPLFEQAVAAYCGARFAVAVANATAALHLLCLALGLDRSKRLWTSPMSFVASANCGRYCGAEVNFVDCDSDSGLMSVAALEEKLRWADGQGCLPDVLVVVHYGGAVCDMKAIATLAEQYSFVVIEDAAHALGAQHVGEPVGNCRYSKACVFSFHPVKPITTAEGGMVCCNDESLALKLRALRSHGIYREENPDGGPWYYEQRDLGYNYRLSDLQAALGESQIKRLDDFILTRRKLARHYHKQLLEVGALSLPPYHLDECGWHLYPIRLPAAMTTKEKSALVSAYHRAGIGVNVHYIPIHLQPYYQSLGFRRGDFPAAENFYQRQLSLPIHPHLSEAQQQYVITTTRQLLPARAA